MVTLEILLSFPKHCRNLRTLKLHLFSFCFKNFLINLIFIFLALCLERSQFPDQGLNLGHVLTTRPPGNSSPPLLLCCYFHEFQLFGFLNPEHRKLFLVFWRPVFFCANPHSYSFYCFSFLPEYLCSALEFFSLYLKNSASYFFSADFSVYVCVHVFTCFLQFSVRELVYCKLIRHSEEKKCHYWLEEHSTDVVCIRNLMWGAVCLLYFLQSSF